MHFLLIGTNHKLAPVEFRERLAMSADDLDEVTRGLHAIPGVDEVMLLSTCNRLEVVVAHHGDRPDLAGWLGERFNLDTSMVRSYFYEHREIDAVQHLFRVASSLDSMVIGESQILGQVKNAYAAARLSGTIGPHLEKLLQSAFFVAKKVRTETQVGNASVSIASVAVDFAIRIFRSLKSKRVMLVGAGQMSELAARQLLKRGATSIAVVNRTYEKAVRLRPPRTLGEVVIPSNYGCRGVR